MPPFGIALGDTLCTKYLGTVYSVHFINVETGTTVISDDFIGLCCIPLDRVSCRIRGAAWRSLPPGSFFVCPQHELGLPHAQIFKAIAPTPAAEGR